MKIPASDLLPPMLVAMALAVAVSVFISETRAFRNAVSEWAARDLDSRTALAAAHLREPLATGDFRAIHAFGASCAADGVRLTVFSAPGGVVFDSVARAKGRETSIYAEKPCGEFKVRLGLPVARVLAPYHRARLGFLLAAAVGGAGVMLIVLFTLRQRARMRELARERDAQRRLVEEMKKVEAFRRDFIADVSHEIKTPLTGILGAIDLFAGGDVPNDMRGRLIDMIKVDGERLNALAQGILSLARLERGDADDVLSRTRVDLSSLVDELTERLAPQATMKGVSLVVHALDPCEVMCDAQLVESAISNLVVNAIRHSGSDSVWISVSCETDKACVVVEDHGVGIAEEHREKVFERFHRVDGSRSAETGGAGLGLAIVRRIARLHGGDVTLEPATPSGCRFTLTLEKAIARAESAEGDRRPSAAVRRRLLAFVLGATWAWAATDLLAGDANAMPLTYGVERIGGVPRFARDGKPFAATAVMPSPAAKPGAAREVLKSFHDAGIHLASDVWTMHDKRYTPRQWWLDDGEYDFAQFDALAHGLADAAADEIIFPRIKIDPPAKWCAAHPEEMMDEVSPLPESAAWRALYRRMLRDVIAHVEKSDYADRVVGYHIGAFHCGEWLTGEWKSPKHRAYIAPVSCASRDALPPHSTTVRRRASLARRSAAVADLLIDAATCVKDCTHNRKLVGAFFGYPSIAHEKLARVLQSGKIDFLAAPPHYGKDREPGYAGRSQSYYQASYRLHGIVYFEESDFRTFLSEPAFAPPRQTRRRPLDESLALVRRSIGKSLAGGWENWWFLLGGNNTFSAPELMASIRIGAAEAGASLETARGRPAEVAVFTAADEYVTSGQTHVPRMAEWGKCRLHKSVLPVCGVPVDSYELSDIADPRLPDYKVYVFPNAITLSDATRAKIKARVRRAGKTAIWFFAPGYYDERGEGSAANVEELTGVAVVPRPLEGDYPCDRMLAPVDRAVCEREGWRSVFMSLPPDAATLRSVFREAGAHVWIETDDVLAVGRGYVMVHAASDGEKTIRLPGTFDVDEIFGASPARKGVSEIVETLKCGETRVWRKRKVPFHVADAAGR